MPGARKFEDLELWKQSFALVRSIYSTTATGAFRQDYPLRDQIRRASISTMANIAEGFSRLSRKEFVRFLDISRGSAQEVQSLLYIARSQAYISEDQFGKLYEECRSLRVSLTAFIRHLRTTDFRA